MKNRIKRIIVFFLAAATVFNICAMPVLAQEENEEFDFTIENSGIIWSEPEFDGWQLSWNVGLFYDELAAVEKCGYRITYQYDGEGRRTKKITPEGIVEYQYDSGGRLLAQNDGKASIEFEYVFDQEMCETVLNGFRYGNSEYKYVFDEQGSIAGIEMDGEMIARYEYLCGVCVGVYGKDALGNWRDKTDDADFVGNINPYRYKRRYLDSETGWYYDGRYYSQEYGRFIDGISEEKVEELALIYGMTNELILKQYYLGASDTALKRKRVGSDNPQINYIATIIYNESRAYHNDQIAVAWCIRSRAECTLSRFSDVTTAYEVVIKSGEFNDPVLELGSGEFAQTALLLAVALYNNNSLGAQPSGYNGQLFFRSVGNAKENIDFAGGYAFIDKVNDDIHKICNISVIDHGTIGSEADLNALDVYIGKRNVFFDYVYP